ncbi:LOW QUALITY PROTEIN: hypothetical protein RJ639_003998 [Escallonia herrerae]|uniref:Uncharacterized protein n=1 Tax=Escallonia herrerae TaxID=1293975 RepID=A0AA88VYB5_9ASTE|nr:LOW QUALITY PROTEIN: hypothetical protein RJ639_003998 [Escallonia herrerae]
MHLQNLWYLNLSNIGSQILYLAPLPRVSLHCYKYTCLRAVPEWIGNRELSDVHIAGCNLRGTLTKFTKPDSLTFIDLSDNHFTQGISNLFPKLSSLQNVKLSNNQLKFDLTKITLPSGLSSLDLHSNLLFGSLSRIINGQTNSFLLLYPTIKSQATFLNLLNLKLLNVAGNRITGQLPSSISNLFRLETLKYLQKPDNRHNSYQFRITAEVVMIPQGRTLNVFQVVAYALSLCLCGKPLPPCKGKKLAKKGQ